LNIYGEWIRHDILLVIVAQKWPMIADRSETVRKIATIKNISTLNDSSSSAKR